MEILIKGTTKEIADLVSEVQGRPGQATRGISGENRSNLPQELTQKQAEAICRKRLEMREIMRHGIHQLGDLTNQVAEIEDILRRPNQVAEIEDFLHRPK